MIVITIIITKKKPSIENKLSTFGGSFINIQFNASNNTQVSHICPHIQTKSLRPRRSNDILALEMEKLEMKPMLYFPIKAGWCSQGKIGTLMANL